MDPFYGEIKMVGFNYAPQYYAFCDGQSMSVNQNQALYSLLGNQYGGQGYTSFNLPDMRGRIPVHQGSGPGLTTRTVGNTGGAESVSIPVANVVTQVTTEDDPQPEVQTASALSAASPAEGAQSVAAMPPFTTVSFVIALSGVYPNRS